MLSAIIKQQNLIFFPIMVTCLKPHARNLNFFFLNSKFEESKFFFQNNPFLMLSAPFFFWVAKFGQGKLTTTLGSL
jgi:hypothetical protein